MLVSETLVELETEENSLLLGGITLMLFSVEHFEGNCVMKSPFVRKDSVPCGNKV